MDLSSYGRLSIIVKSEFNTGSVATHSGRMGSVYPFRLSLASLGIRLGIVVVPNRPEAIGSSHLDGSVSHEISLLPGENSATIFVAQSSVNGDYS